MDLQWADEEGFETEDTEPMGLTFDEWVEVSARLAALELPQRRDLLVSLEIDPFVWDAAELYWGATIAREMKRGEHARAAVYCRRVAEGMRHRSVVSAQKRA
jgi:hypothetical protein